MILLEIISGDQIDKEKEVSGAIFAGEIAKVAEGGLILNHRNEAYEWMRNQMNCEICWNNSIDQPISNESPEDSGAITGAYTKEDAEEWIADIRESHVRSAEG